LSAIPEAVAEKVVQKRTGAESMELRVGEKVSREFISEFLNASWFRKYRFCKR